MTPTCAPVLMPGSHRYHTLPDRMAPASSRRFGEAAKKGKQAAAYIPHKPLVERMPNTHSRYNTKCIPFRQKLVSAKVQESGSPMERRIMRCTTRRRRTLPKPFWCTVQVAAWVSQQYKSRAV